MYSVKDAAVIPIDGSSWSLRICFPVDSNSRVGSYEYSPNPNLSNERRHPVNQPQSLVTNVQLIKMIEMSERIETRMLI